MGFIYAVLEWGPEAGIGISPASDSGLSAFEHELSRTSESRSVLSETNIVGVDGVYLYRVDGNVVNGLTGKS